MSGSGRDPPPGCPGVVGMSTQMSGSGREALPDVWDWSGGPPVCPVVLRWHSRMSWSGREVHPDLWEWAGGPLVCPAVVGRPS